MVRIIKSPVFGIYYTRNFKKINSFFKEIKIEKLFVNLVSKGPRLNPGSNVSHLFADRSWGVFLPSLISIYL